MKATIGHIGINLSNSKESFQFWKDLLHYLDFKIVEDGSTHFHANDGSSYLCVNVAEKNYTSDGFHRKRTGLNHLAFRVSSQKLVDQFVADVRTVLTHDLSTNHLTNAPSNDHTCHPISKISSTATNTMNHNPNIGGFVFFNDQPINQSTNQ